MESLLGLIKKCWFCIQYQRMVKRKEIHSFQNLFSNQISSAFTNILEREKERKREGERGLLFTQRTNNSSSTSIQGDCHLTVWLHPATWMAWDSYYKVTSDLIYNKLNPFNIVFLCRPLYGIIYCLYIALQCCYLRIQTHMQIKLTMFFQ